MRSRVWALVAVGSALAAVVVVLALFSRETRLRPIGPGEAEPSVPEIRHAVGRAPFAPHAFVDEPESAPSTGPVREALEVLVIEPGQAPAAGARVHVVGPDESLVGARWTDSAGIARMPPAAGEGVAYVVAEGYGMHVAPIDLAAGRRRIELPARAAISGFVQVEGGGSPAGVRLYALPIVWPEIPYAIRALDEIPRTGTTPFRTDAAGRFVFAGLAPGPEWGFQASVEYRLLDITLAGKPVKAIAAPADGVVVHLNRVPVISGRVVMMPDRHPVEGATVALLEQEPDGRASGKSLYTGVDGRFRAGLLPPQDPEARAQGARKLEITVGDPQDTSHRELEIDPSPESDRDLGDLELPAARVVEFVVKDVAGKPIAGAFARKRPGAAAEPSSRTDERGRGTLRVSADRKAFWVGALRHEVVEVAIPAVAREPLLVVLPANAGLEITLKGALAGASSFHARLTTRRLFGTEDLSIDPILEAAGANDLACGSGSDEQSVVEFAFSAEGRIMIAGIAPDNSILVELVDPFCLVHDSKTVHVTAGTWQTIGFEVTKKATALRGVVVDQAGEPVRDAHLEVGADPDDPGKSSAERTMKSETDAAGRFGFEPLFCDRVRVTVAKPGFVTIEAKGFVVPADGSDVTFTLVPGAPYVVRFATPAGTPIRELVVNGEVPGLPPLWGASEPQPGHYRFEGLPSTGTLTVTTRYGGRDWKRSFPLRADSRESLFELPATGRVVVQWEGEAFANCVSVVFEPRDPEGSAFSHLICFGGCPSSGTLEFHVVPGDYTVSLVRKDYGEDGATSSTRTLASQPTTVVAGATANVALKKP